MKERGILFTGWNVRRIQADQKTHTRRVCGDRVAHLDGPAGPLYTRKLGSAVWESGLCPWHCPYGKTGDRLWVRETFAIDNFQYLGALAGLPPSDPSELYFAADGEDLCAQVPECDCSGGVILWRPSIFMPRWASRLTLEITHVRLERVQDISEADAIAEGCEMDDDGMPKEQPHESGIGMVGWDSAIEWYSDLWDSINAARGFSWERNPWVWVIVFKRLISAVADSNEVVA